MRHFACFTFSWFWDSHAISAIPIGRCHMAAIWCPVANRLGQTMYIKCFSHEQLGPTLEAKHRMRYGIIMYRLYRFKQMVWLWLRDFKHTSKVTRISSSHVADGPVETPLGKIFSFAKWSMEFQCLVISFFVWGGGWNVPVLSFLKNGLDHSGTLPKVLLFNWSHKNSQSSFLGV